LAHRKLVGEVIRDQKMRKCVSAILLLNTMRAQLEDASCTSPTKKKKAVSVSAIRADLHALKQGNEDEVDDIHHTFSQFDADGSGEIDVRDCFSRARHTAHHHPPS